MLRRDFLCAFLALMYPVNLSAKSDKNYRYRIRTKSGGIVGGTIRASDSENAKFKITKRYPDCQFISLKEV